MKFTIQHKLTDRWECLQDYPDKDFAINRARELAKDHVTYGMTRVIKGNQVIKTFSRNGHEF